MAKETKIFCDRCRKDITKSTWRGVLKLPTRITLQVIYDNGFSTTDFNFDLCDECRHEIYRILEGEKDGK